MTGSTVIEVLEEELKEEQAMKDFSSLINFKDEAVNNFGQSYENEF